MTRQEFHRIVHECGLSSERLTNILFETCPVPNITEDELRQFMHRKDTIKALRVCLGMIRGEKWAFEEARRMIEKFLEEHGVFLVILEIRSEKSPQTNPFASRFQDHGKSEADVIDEIADMFNAQPLDPRKAH